MSAAPVPLGFAEHHARWSDVLEAGYPAAIRASVLFPFLSPDVTVVGPKKDLIGCKMFSHKVFKQKTCSSVGSMITPPDSRNSPREKFSLSFIASLLLEIDEFVEFFCEFFIKFLDFSSGSDFDFFSFDINIETNIFNL